MLDLAQKYVVKESLSEEYNREMPWPCPAKKARKENRDVKYDDLVPQDGPLKDLAEEIEATKEMTFQFCEKSGIATAKTLFLKDLQVMYDLENLSFEELWGIEMVRKVFRDIYQHTYALIRICLHNAILTTGSSCIFLGLFCLIL